MKIFIILGLIFSFINLSYSKECSGKWSNTVKMLDTIDLGEGTTLTVLSTRGSTTSDNSKNNAVGGCGVLVLNLPNGETKTMGSCFRKTSDGTWTDIVGQNPGESEGYWKFLEGAGSLEGFKGEGTFDTIFANSETSIGNWKGECNK